MIFKSVISFLFCCFCIALQVQAQPSYWEKAEAKYQSDYRQRIVDNMNMKSGKPTTTPGSNGSTPEFMKTKEQKAADAAYVADVRQREAAAYQREQDRIRDHQLYLQRIANEKAEQKRIFIKNSLDQLSGSKMFSRVECEAFAQDEFYRLYSNSKSPNPPDYLTSSKYVMKFIGAVPETPLDTLINYVWQSRLFSDFSTKKIQELQQRFPAAKERLERLELYILAYYFGASKQYATPAGGGYAYPLCSFELMADEQKTTVLNRFEELETAYPEVALKMAADCRVNFNVFYKYATSNLALKNKTSAKRLEYLYKTLETVQANRVLPKEGFIASTWRFLADQLLRGAATELKLIYPGFVEDLSSERWLEIAKASKLNVEYIAWAFRDNDYDYLKKLPNLTNALKEEFKKADDGEGTITFKNSDRYVGAIKNGKPNGIGKYTSAIGDTYEGNFKDGYLHGNGKSYAAKKIGSGANTVIFEGDFYEGEYDNGARHGKGTLTNLNNLKYKYAGDWVNGKKDGKGEETGEEGYKTYTFTGSYKKGNKDYGVMSYNDGSSYTGNFDDGYRDGKGILKNADGSTLVGKWDRGDIDGKGVLTSANGYVMKYENDIEKRVSKGKEYGRSTRQKNIKYYSPDGKEITEAEYKANK